MDFIDNIKEIERWVTSTFTSAYIERSIDEESHSRRWTIHHADYMVTISYNYIYDYVNGVVSIKHKDPSTGQFMTEEYEGVPVNQFKEFVINYLEENKDKVKPYKGDDETLISHMNLGAKVHHIDGNVYNNDIKNVVPLDNKGKIKNDSFVEDFVNGIIEDD